jgi:hypothetical protein
MVGDSAADDDARRCSFLRDMVDAGCQQCHSLGGDTDQWTPYPFRNTTQIFPWVGKLVGKPGCKLSTGIADDSIKYLQELNAAARNRLIPFRSH